MNKTLVSIFLLALVSLAGCNCNPANCKPGDQACGCLEGGACNAGLVCGADNLCVAPVAAGLQVPDPAARGCELLVTEAPGSEVVSVTFKNGATGTWLRQAPKVAITVVSGADSALAGSVDLGLTGPAAGLSIARSSCVDVKGQRLNSTLSIR